MFQSAGSAEVEIALVTMESLPTVQLTERSAATRTTTGQESTITCPFDFYVGSLQLMFMASNMKPPLWLGEAFNASLAQVKVALIATELIPIART